MVFAFSFFGFFFAISTIDLKDYKQICIETLIATHKNKTSMYFCFEFIDEIGNVRVVL